MRRLVICCDGSWQKLGSKYPTNVVKLAQAVRRRDARGVSQVVFYSEGVGAQDRSRVRGALGLGLDADIIEAYTFLALNYEPGDEVYLFGFSRGAYTVRSLAGFMHCCGLVSRKLMRAIPEAYELYRNRAVKPDSVRARKFRTAHGGRIPIAVLGCWDTVGALGFPAKLPGAAIDGFFRARYRFHDIRINRGVQHAFQAKAIDEQRAVFEITPMVCASRRCQTIEEAWFPGDHGCVGGGHAAKAPLSNRCLHWMVERLSDHGLKLATDLGRVEGGVAVDHTVAFDNRVRSWFRLGGTEARPITGDFKNLDLSVRRRWRDCPGYRPDNLRKRFGGRLDAWREAKQAVGKSNRHARRRPK